MKISSLRLTVLSSRPDAISKLKTGIFNSYIIMIAEPALALDPLVPVN